MKSKLFNIMSIAAFIGISQLLFFWLVPTSASNFVVTYPFYTVLVISHLAITYYLGNKYGLPASIAPTIVGSIITILEMIVAIVLCLICTSVRSVLFVNAIIIFIYVFAMTIFVSMCNKETENDASEISQNSINNNQVSNSISDFDIPAEKRMPHPNE